MMEVWIQQWLASTPGGWFEANSLVILFGVGFLAATVLPMGSEPVLVMALLGQTEPVAAVLAATAGNSLGAVSTWALGRWCTRWWPISEANRKRAEDWYRRWGHSSLLMTWMPIVGDALCWAGGLFRVALPRFLVLVTAGKLARYAVLAWATVGIASSAGPFS